MTLRPPHRGRRKDGDSAPPQPVTDYARLPPDGIPGNYWLWRRNPVRDGPRRAPSRALPLRRKAGAIRLYADLPFAHAASDGSRDADRSDLLSGLVTIVRR